MTSVIYLGQDAEYASTPMVELNYIKEFRARVVETGPNYAVLDRTAFYAEGGGQPSDTGQMHWEAGTARVSKVVKQGGIVRHLVDTVPPKGDVTGSVDWERRYAHMRMHTAQHLLSGLVFQMYGARTMGNQLYMDYSHVDFAPASFTQENLAAVEKAFNEAVESGVQVTIYEEERRVLEERIEEERAIMDLIPKGIRRLRVVQIGDVDLCPCAGTHVRNVSEIGRMRILRRRSKGKDIDRITYELL